MKKISILITCYRSETTIEKVVNDIKKEFKKNSYSDYEIILVNDASPDHVLSVIQKLVSENSMIKGVDLSKNYGQLSAKMAGLKYVTGDYLVYMDDDGQCPVEHLFDLIECLNAGSDIAYAAYTVKKTTFFKKVTSDIHSRITELTLGKPKGVKISNFYAVNHLVIEALRNYNSPFPSPLGYMLQITRNIANVPMVEHERMQGKTTYNLKKLFSQWLTVFTNFSVVPLRLIFLCGFLFATLGILLAMYFVIKYICFGSAVGYTSIVCLLLIIGGLIMVSLGFIGEYVGRIYITLSGKPQFFIREILDNTDKKR